MKPKIILRTLLLVVIAYAIYYISDASINGHWTPRPDTKWKDYMFFFNDSIKKDIDTLLVSTSETKKDILNYFTYQPSLSFYQDYLEAIKHSDTDTLYSINIWEFKDLFNFPIDSVKFHFNQSLGRLKVKRGEILEPNSNQPISIIWGYNFKKIKINVDNKSNISSLNITGKNYKGFFGEVNRLSMSNQDDKHYVFIDNIPKMDILFLVVNKSNKFYIIIISCNKKFDKDIFNILNLD